MIEFISNYGLFLAKTVTIVVAIAFLASGIISTLRRERDSDRERITVKNLNEFFEDLSKSLTYEMLPAHEQKKMRKREKKRHKEAAKSGEAETDSERKRIFVLNFKGDIAASAIAALRQEITAIVSVARPEDEVVLRLESAGGVVNAYGLAASQLIRIKEKSIPLTIAVDRVAASGGYMMACVADKIIAAPFSVLGSIGVMSELPNFHRLLKKHDIDYEQITAGEYKRTLTVFGENTDKARTKFTEQIEDAHGLFKEFVKHNRPNLDIDTVATGEYWYGTRAHALNLVDQLATSDDYLLQLSQDADVFEVTYKPKETLREKLAAEFEQVVERLGLKAWTQLEKKRFG
ncbi:MAG: protease SohB [Deferribacteres bacterium]|nr:protease SohB [Deferribacteres bacterium]